MDNSKIQELAQRVVADTGGTFTITLCYIGDRLGLFRLMAGVGVVSSEQLALKTDLSE